MWQTRCRNCFIIKNKFQITVVQQHDVSEVFNIDLKIGNCSNFYCELVYRSPSSKCEWFYLYEKHVEIITSTSNNVIIIDDLNVDENKNSNLKNAMITHGLFQIIEEATRKTKDSSTPPPLHWPYLCPNLGVYANTA